MSIPRLIYAIAIIVLVISPLSRVYAFRASDTVKVYFGLDQREPGKMSTKLLDSLVYEEVITPDNDLMIIGYADYLGADDYNQKLSADRAKFVQDYLAKLGIKKTNIKLCMGKGEVERGNEGPDGYAADRRVDIVQALGKTTLPEPAVANQVPLRNTPINKIKVGQTLVLERIYFHAGRQTVRDESLPELDNLYNSLKAHPNIKIKIEGHVCCVPAFTDALDEDTFEHTLSRNRARYIHDYLVKRGIDPARLSYQGFGKTRPLVKEERSFRDEEMNRRVEIRVIEN